MSIRPLFPLANILQSSGCNTQNSVANQKHIYLTTSTKPFLLSTKQTKTKFYFRSKTLKMAAEAERKLMIAIDESEYSHYALMWVLDNLKDSLTKSPLFIFMAQPPPRNNYSFAASFGSARLYSPISAVPEFANSVKENNKKLALAYLGKAKEICASRGVSAEIITEVGDPKSTICNVAQKLNIGMLVLGERGLGKIKRALIGSVSNYCVQYAKCPVLVVKKP